MLEAIQSVSVCAAMLESPEPSAHRMQVVSGTVSRLSQNSLHVWGGSHDHRKVEPEHSTDLSLSWLTGVTHKREIN